MVEQLAGAATATVIVLVYVVLVETLTAACVLLAEFTIVRIQALRTLLQAAENPPEVLNSPQLVSPGEPRSYKLGGDVRFTGDARW